MTSSGKKVLTTVSFQNSRYLNSRYGAENSDNPKTSHQAVDRFVKGLTAIPIFGIVKEYAETKVYLRKNGTPLHDEFDLIIGVTARANELTLVTDNTKDFRSKT